MSYKVKLTYYYKEKSMKLARDLSLQECRPEMWDRIYR